MKFEKFLKSVGTYGEVVTINESDEKWLVCGGVGMVIPRGVDNLLGKSTDNEYASIVHALTNAVYDDPVTLSKAVLLDPAGNAKAIYRVFETDLGETVGIINADYGLLEKRDLLGYGEIETDDGTTIKYLLVFNHSGNIIGFITGTDKF